MIKNLTCIECPKGCRLTVEVDAAGKVIHVSGNQCPKGETYGAAEIENPTRILTASVLGHGLSLKMIPVRTDQAIPRGQVMGAMALIKQMKVDRPVKAGEIISKNFMGLGVNLIATRDVGISRSDLEYN